MVDVETDGPCPGLFSMLSLGAVVVNPAIECGAYYEFYARFRPISDRFEEEALKVNNVTREETLEYPEPQYGMKSFHEWLYRFQKPIFVSDNNGFDWQFVNYYFHRFIGTNPFGHSSQNLGSLYKGMQKNCFESFKHLRDTPHTHHPVDDARGNAEALLKMVAMGLKIGL